MVKQKRDREADRLATLCANEKPNYSRGMPPLCERLRISRCSNYSQVLYYYEILLPENEHNRLFTVNLIVCDWKRCVRTYGARERSKKGEEERESGGNLHGSSVCARLAQRDTVRE